MLKTVKVIFANGVLTPLEPVELEESAEYKITIEGVLTGDIDPDTGRPKLFPKPSEEATRLSRQAMGKWKGMFDDPEGLIRDIYAARLANSRHEIDSPMEA